MSFSALGVVIVLPTTTVIGSMAFPPLVSKVTVTVSPRETFVSPFTYLTKYNRSLRSMLPFLSTSAATRSMVTDVSAARYLARRSTSVELTAPSLLTSPYVTEISLPSPSELASYAKTGTEKICTIIVRSNTIEKNERTTFGFFLCILILSLLSFLFFGVTAYTPFGKLIVLKIKSCKFAEPTDWLYRQKTFPSRKARTGRRTRDLLSAFT